MREVPCQAAEVGDAGVGDDQPDVGVAVDERREVVADRRQAAAAVDQDRDVALDREREDASSRSSPSENFCARGWSLIPRAPRSRQRGRLLDRPLVEVEADERDDPVGLLPRRTRACGRSPR